MTIIKVTPNQVRAAKLRLILDKKLGRESEEAIVAIANAREPSVEPSSREAEPS
jgi:hypothetical protein